MTRAAKAPYLIGLKVVPEAVAGTEYPFNLPCIRSLDLRITRAVTFLVGENGTGKSSTIEAGPQSDIFADPPQRRGGHASRPGRRATRLARQRTAW